MRKQRAVSPTRTHHRKGRSLRSGHFSVSLVLALATGVAAIAGAESIDDEIRLQEELLSRLDGGPSPVSTPPTLPDAAAGRSRVAPRTPIDRDYPSAIFDESQVVVAPGTWGNHERMVMIYRVLDADRDGHPEVQRWIDPESKLLVRQVEDRNYDGVQDTFSDYAWGAVRARTLDSNDDGTPDTWERYEKGYMTSREVDRDDDGKRDAFYSYRGDSLKEERHDANGDGRVDLVIVYENRRRLRSEEDVDRDGRVDTRTHFAPGSGPELAIRIERDTLGNGGTDTVEFFDTDSGTAIIGRSERDVDGDGRVDIVSFYEKGKLVRREIHDPEAAAGS